MKTKFTLLTLALVCILTNNLKAQLNESFETPGSAITYGDLDNYTALGWSFYGAYWDSTSQITAKGSIYVIPTTSTINNNNSNSNTTQVVTPWLNLNNGGKITFNYKLASALGNNQDRTFTIRLWDANNVGTTLSSFTITGTTPVGVVQTSPSITIPANSGNRRIIIDFTGRGDGNSFMFFDNLSVTPASSFLAATLPIKLLGFNGYLENNKAKIEWSVDANETGSYFEVQKSSDGKSFSRVTMLFTTEKAGIESYQFQEGAKGDAYYRLYIVNKDHSVAYSKVVHLKEQSQTNSVQEIKLLQNPIQQNLRFSFFSAAAEQNIITVYNMAGIPVYTASLMAQQGNNTVNLPVDNRLQAGSYVLEVKGSVVRRMVKVTK